MKRIGIDVPRAPRLEVKDLRVALAVAETGTTARAAEVLHLTQPAVSRALLAAEERAGVRLFDRSARGLRPTTAGVTLLEGGRKLLLELAELEERLRAPLQPPRRLRMVCECYTAYHWLPSAVRGLRDALPALEITIALEHTGAPIDALVSGAVDVALLTTGSIPRGQALEDLEKGDLVAKRFATGGLRRPWRMAWRREARDAALRLGAMLERAVPHARLVG